MPQSKCQNLTCNQRDPHTVGSRTRTRTRTRSRARYKYRYRYRYRYRCRCRSKSRLEDPGAVLVCPPGPGVRHAPGRQAD